MYTAPVTYEVRCSTRPLEMHDDLWPTSGVSCVSPALANREPSPVYAIAQNFRRTCSVCILPRGWRSEMQRGTAGAFLIVSYARGGRKEVLRGQAAKVARENKETLWRIGGRRREGATVGFYDGAGRFCCITISFLFF